MLAPMQGLTNWALRKAFIGWGAPDVVWTEFLRVASRPGKPVLPADRKDLQAADPNCPLVVQLIGGDPLVLESAAKIVQNLGARHVNLNLGCPYGRMTKGKTGGTLLQEPERALEIVRGLRDVVSGSFSVKMRAGYDDAEQIFSLLPEWERIGIDFLVIHPRTVVQQYEGKADHGITRRVVQETSLPVIANGDISSGAQGRQILADTGAAGLMLGRWALVDPLLFERVRRPDLVEPTEDERLGILRGLLERVMDDYCTLFCGEVQTLHKLKNIFALNQWPALNPALTSLKKARTLKAFHRAMAGLPTVPEVPPPPAPAEGSRPD